MTAMVILNVVVSTFLMLGVGSHILKLPKLRNSAFKQGSPNPGPWPERVWGGGGPLL